MKYKVGDKLKPKEKDICGHYDREGSYYIKISRVEDSYYAYDIFNLNDTKTGNCSHCFNDNNLTLISKSGQMDYSKENFSQSITPIAESINIHQLLSKESRYTDIYHIHNWQGEWRYVFWETEPLSFFQKYWFENQDGEQNWILSNDTYAFTLINKKITTIKKMTNTIKNLFRTEPSKTFIKAGFMDDKEEITSKGKEALEYILWTANADALKKIADDLIAEDNK